MYSNATKYKRSTTYKPVSSKPVAKVATRHTSQYQMRQQRSNVGKNIVKPTKYDQYDEEEKVTVGKGANSNGSLYQSTGLHDFTLVEFEKMKERIKILEADSVRKDDTIKKLKVENGRLRAHRNVLEGKVKKFTVEKAKSANKPASSSNLNMNHPINGAFEAAMMPKMPCK